MQDTSFSQPLLEISLLGKFQVKIGGLSIEEKRWGRRSAKSLVKLLALKPFHALHREQVMDLLWTEETPETALNNLNKAIYGARRAFEPDLVKGSASQFLLTEKNHVTLASPGSLRIDLDEFEKSANFAIQNNDLAAGQQAIELYRGDLLIEDIYEDWIYARRESIRILYRKVATKTAELYAAQGEQAAGSGILKKLIDEDATDEYVHRLLMRFYAGTGSKYQALKQLEHCRAALNALGIEPEPATIKLGQSIKRGEILASKKEVKYVPLISTPRITPLTFQNGVIKSARFSPDGEKIVFSADWNGGVAELYALHPETGETQRIGIENAQIFSISAAGEIAVALNPKIIGFASKAILATTDLSGGESSKLLKDVYWADWHPSKNADFLVSDEQYLAVVRDRYGKNCLEFPVGNVIYETTGWLGHPRFSLDGKKLAIIEHPLWGDDRGFIVCFDLENGLNEKQVLTANFNSIQGLAWFKNEIWFTGAHQGNMRIINAVNLEGAERPIYRATGRLTLHDISKDGKVLVTDDKMRIQVAVRHETDETERDLSWHDWTLPRDLTDDGKILLFEEAGFSGGKQLAAYIRNTDSTGIKKLADAAAITFSPGGKYALLKFHSPHQTLALIPIKEGTIKTLETDPANPLTYDVLASFFPDGKRIMFSANDARGERQIYIQEIDGGMPVRFKTDEPVKMLSCHTISPDGEYAVLTNSDNRLALYKISSGTSFPLKNLDDEFYLVRWAGDGENLFIWQRGEIPASVYKYNLATGNKKKWLELMPVDSLGVHQFATIKLTPDGKTYSYCYTRESSELHLIEDLE